jgi:transposase
MFSYLFRRDHPWRPIRISLDVVLKGLSRSFGGLYGDWGQPSIAAEKLSRALVLQVYSIRSGRMLEEQLEYNLLSRWRVGLDMDAPLVAPHSVQQESRLVAKLGYN